MQSYISRLDDMNWHHVNDIFTSMEETAVDLLESAGVEPEKINIERSAEMRYVGQGFEIVVPVPNGNLGPASQNELATAFNTTYEALFGRVLNEVPVETITWRTTGSEPPPRPEIRFQTVGSGAHSEAIKGERPVFVTEENQFVECPVFDRYSLDPGFDCQRPGNRRRARVDRLRGARSTLHH